jgi:hypothetical protein
MPLTELKTFIEDSNSNDSSKRKAISFIQPLEASDIRDIPALIKDINEELKNESFANVLNSKLKKNLSERTAVDYFRCFMRFYKEFNMKNKNTIPSKKNDVPASECKKNDLSNLFLMAEQLKKHEENQDLDDETKEQIQIILLKKLGVIVNECISNSES